MSYLALYRKYRPSNFSDLVGQSSIANIIKNEILNDKISHAYLFSGPRGTGKTSTAKIIAKMINCKNLSNDGFPCEKCDSCVNFASSSDVVEIDAASNNGVDEIRDLRDKVNLVPVYGRFKIYIIDEVHMLTTQAFNALLKTLEEPPAHVVFILATTEFYKIPITVVSRCQKFQFLKFSDDDIISRLRYIADRESISVGDDVLSEIARLSDGGMRDAINMLDQLSACGNGSFTVEDIYNLNGVLSYDDFFNLLDYIYNNDVSSIVSFVEKVDNSGKNMERFIGDFISFLKDLLVFKSTGNFVFSAVDKEELFNNMSEKFEFDTLYSMIISLNDLSIRLKNSSFGMILIVSELINLAIKLDSKLKPVENVINYVENKVSVNGDNTGKSKKNDIEINNLVTKFSDKDKMIRINNSFATASKDLKDKFLKKWDEVKEKTTNNSLYFSITGMINDIDVMVVGVGYVIFVAQYDSLLDRLYEKINLVESLLFDVFSERYRCVFLLLDEWNYEKNKYVDNVKNGKKYELIIEEDSSLSDDNGDVEKIVSILGNDIISYE